MAVKRKQEDIENIPPRSKRHKPGKENVTPRRVLRSLKKASNGPELKNCKSSQTPRTKRKLQNSDDAPKQLNKRQKLEDYFSWLSRNDLDIVLANLKPQDRCMKPLSETCTKLKRLCEPRINILSLNFDRIAGSGEFPSILRSYNEIRLFGKEIPEELPSIQRMLESSLNSGSVLCIGTEDAFCEMHLRTFLFILNCFPAMQELDLQNVNIISPSSGIEHAAFPPLQRLSKLTLCNCSGEALFSAFRHMQNLDELRIEGTYQEDPAFNTLIASQRSLFSLMSNTNALQLDDNSLPQLEILEIPDESLSFKSRLPEKVFDIAPNVLHIKLLGRSASRHLFPTDSFLMNSSSSHLRSIQTGMDSPADFDILRVQENYPSLTLFKSANVEWRK